MGYVARKVRKATSNVTGAARDVVNDPLRVVKQEVVQPVSEGLANIEDIAREGIEGIDEALQNKYVRQITKAVAALSPDPITRSVAIALDSYQTLDSGENLSPSQVVNIVAAGAQLSGAGTAGAEAGLEDMGFSTDIDPNAFPVDAAGNVTNVASATGIPNTVFDDVSFRLASSVAKIEEGADPKDVLLSEFGGDLKNVSPEAFKAVNAGVKIAQGADPVLTLAEAYGEDFATKLGLKEKAETGLRTAIGEDAYNLVKDNLDIARVGYDVGVLGKTPLESVSNRYGDEIVGLINSDDPNVNALGIAGLKTAVQLDKGVAAEDALFEGAKEYYDRGGRLPDLATLGVLTGVTVPEFGLNSFLDKYNIDLPDLEGMGYSLPSLAGLGIDLTRFDLNTPKLLENFSLDQLPDLGFDIGNLDFKGLDVADLGNYSLRDLSNMGVNLGDLNIEIGTFNTPDLGDFALPEFGMPEIAFSGGEIPEYNLPDINMPNIDIPNIPLNLGLGGQRPQQPGMLAPLQAKLQEEEQKQQEGQMVDIPELLLADLSLKNPLLRG